MTRTVVTLALLFLLVLTVPPRHAARPRPFTVTFPIKLSADNRYFVDHNNVPWLLIGDAPQSLIGDLSVSEQTIYFANRQSKGFNAVWVNLLCADYTHCAASGKTFDNVPPFTSGDSPANYDLATPNETYFARVDAMVNLAAAYGFVVLLDPVETGSWLKTLLGNGETKAFNYGVFVGNRYKDFANIIWLHGNDFNTWETAANNHVVGEVMRGIASVDSSHLQTCQIQSRLRAQQIWATQDVHLLPWLNINLAYTYSPTYDAVWGAYNGSPTLPVYLSEGHYENESHITYGTPYVLRETGYWTLTSGGIGGYNYGDFYTVQSLWIADPTTRLHSRGARQIAHLNKVFNGIQWWRLVPDQTHVVVTAGYGSCPTGTGQDLSGVSCCTTSYAGSDLAVTYCSKSSTVTVDMTKFAGSVTARRFDPSNGTFTTYSGSPFANTGTHDFALSGNNADGDPDWVLLLESQKPIR